MSKQYKKITFLLEREGIFESFSNQTCFFFTVYSGYCSEKQNRNRANNNLPEHHVLVKLCSLALLTEQTYNSPLLANLHNHLSCSKSHTLH